MVASIDSSVGDRPRVLVVDDDVMLRRVVRTALVQSGFDVAQVGTGRDALSLASAYDFDLIITDLEMPGMGGLELLRALRARQLDTPVVVMSGAAEARAQVMLSGGSFAFLAKPFSMDELVRVAGAAVERPETIAAPSSGTRGPRLVGAVA